MSRTAHQIVLTDGQIALVDGEDHARLPKNTAWRANKGYAGNHVVRAQINKKQVYLHRLIMLAPDGYVVDHLNGDPLDNRKENLRIVTCVENSRNIAGPNRSNKSSGVRGVYANGPNWVARIRHHRKLLNLGTYKTIAEAKAARDAAEICLWSPEDRTRQVVYDQEARRHA